MDAIERARNDARLGRLILETRAGAALATGIKHLHAAIAAFEQAGYQRPAIEARIDLGQLHLRLEEHAKAAEVLERAYRELATQGDALPVRLAQVAGLVAGAQEGAGDLAAAGRFRYQAVQHAQASGDEVAFAEQQLGYARLAVRQGLADDAIEAAEQALELFSERGRDAVQAACMEVLGVAYAVRGEDTRSDGHFSDSVEVSLALGNTTIACETLYRHAQVARERRRGLNAIALLERCINVSRSRDDKRTQARSLRLIGRIRDDMGEHHSAAAVLERALDLAVAARDLDGQARAHYLLGRIHVDLGELVAAIQSFTSAMGCAQELDEPVLLERILAAMTAVHSKLGSHDAALEALRRWDAILRERGDRREQLRLLGAMAQVQEERGALDEAETHLRWLLAICRDEADAPERLRAYHGLGVVLAKRGEHVAASDHFALSLLEFDQLSVLGGDPPVAEAQLCYRFGSSLLQHGRGRDGLELFERALAVVDGDQRLQARILVGMGNALAQLGEQMGARSYFEQAAKLFEKQGDAKTTKIIRKVTESLSG